MQIQRYLNGKEVTATELSRLELATPELEAAVGDARKRMRQGIATVTANEQAAVWGSELSDVRRADG